MIHRLRRHLVIGMGEVGSAVASVLRDEFIVYTKDLNYQDDFQSVDVVHICFPWSEKFITSVKNQIEEFNPELTIIHSTVPVGTSTELGVCHSPIRGKHPYLAESIKTFVKFFGGTNAQEAANVFIRCGVTTYVTNDAETTEAGKLWELLMYGLAVAQQKEMYKWCEESGADPDVAYRIFTETYNHGYNILGDAHVRRPVIKPMDGQIGGHCVIQNSALVYHRFAELLIELNENW